jgi:hypothetical protein
MILYKGNTLVEGKHFIYEDEKVTYKGKCYGKFHLFERTDKPDLVLDESEITALKLYETCSVDEADDADDLRTLLVGYLEKGLNLLDSNNPNKVNELITFFEDFKNHLDQMGCTYQYSMQEIDLDELLDFIKYYLETANMNVSQISIPNLYVTICQIIYNLYKLRERGETNGNMEQEESTSSSDTRVK